MNEKRRGHDASCQIWSQLRQIYGKWPPPHFLLGSHLSQGARELNTHKLARFPFSSGSALWPSGAKHSILAALSPESPLLPASLPQLNATYCSLFIFLRNCFTSLTKWLLSILLNHMKSENCLLRHPQRSIHKSPKTQKPTRRNEDDYAPAS